MIVVQTSTSASPSANSSMTFSSASSAIWPCPTTIRAPGSMSQLSACDFDGLDAVVDEEDLAAALDLAQDRLADEPGRRLGDVGLDRQPVLRRRLDRRQVADAGERHVQRPRDRRRRESQHVDLAPHLLEVLLVRDTEPLLLVDDHEPEVLEATSF